MKATIDGVLLEGTVGEIVEYMRLTSVKVSAKKPQHESLLQIAQRLEDADYMPLSPNAKLRGTPKQLKVIDTKGDCRIYPSMQHFCRASGLSYWTIRNKFQTSDVVRIQGWTIEKLKTT